MASHAYHEKTESTWLLVWYHKLSDVQAFLMFAFWTVLEGFKFLHVCMCKYTLWWSFWRNYMANTHPNIGCYRNKASRTWTPPPPPFQLSKKYLCNWWVSTGKPTDEVENEALLLVFIRRVETFGLAWGSRLLTASNTFKTTILRPTYPKIYIHMNQLV